MNGREQSRDERLWLLLVDDDRELRDLVIGAVDPVRFHVELAEGVPAAKLLAQRHRFHMLVCGRVATLAELHDCLMARGTRGVAFAAKPAVTGGRGSTHVAPRPATIAELRQALLEAAARPMP